MALRRFPSLAAAAALLASSAAAQPAPSDTINVIGRRPEEVRREAQDFVRKLGVAERPVARWVEPICPRIFGVAPEIGKRVTERIRAAAREARVRIAKEPCRTNILISFVVDGRALAQEIAAREPARLSDVAPEGRPALLNSDAPIRWWHATEMQTVDGLGTTGNEQPPFAMGDSPGGVPMAGEVHLQYRSSIVSTQMVRVLKAATIIVDVNRATGKSLDSVASFVALVALAEIGIGEDAPSNSILSLFAPDGLSELTTLDRGFLRALYELPLDRTARAQRGLLVKGLLARSGDVDE